MLDRADYNLPEPYIDRSKFYILSSIYGLCSFVFRLVCVVLCVLYVLRYRCGVSRRPCVRFAVWLCGVCSGVCVSALLEPWACSALRSRRPEPRHRLLCLPPLPGAPPTLVRLDCLPALSCLTAASASGGAQDCRGLVYAPSFDAPVPLHPRTRPPSAVRWTWTPLEYDASLPSPSQDTSSRSPPRPALPYSDADVAWRLHPLP